jgi:hypothetical protein
MLKYIFMILISVLLSGCVTVPSYTFTPLNSPPVIKMFDPEIYTFKEVLNMFINSGMVLTALPDIADTRYVLPQREWVEKVLSPKFKNYLTLLEISPQENTWDCDDITRECEAFVVREYNKTDHPPGTTLLWGRYAFITTNLMGHILNISLIQSGPIQDILFYEPQIQKEVELAGFERAATITWGY